MKGFKLIFVLILVIRAIKTQSDEEEVPSKEEPIIELEGVVEDEDVIKSAEESEIIGDTSISLDDNDDDDDAEGRRLRVVEILTSDERCNDVGVCSDMQYGDKDVVVSFKHNPEIRFTSGTTYKIKDPKDYSTLTFINSKFFTFPLNLFYAFKVQELDIRNCSMETVKWDNFLMAEKLIILLLSENLLTEIPSSLFSLAENLSFLFLDSNRISILHNESFKGLTKLSYLDLHNNLIEILPSEIFSHVPNIQQINLAENRLKSIEHILFTDNPHLFSIHLQRNDLQEIQEYAFQNQNNLKYLDISNNPQLEAFVSSNLKVENLWAKNCSLKRINIYGEAVHVDLQQNRIQELYFSKPEYLETLSLKDNALEQISSLAATTSLRTLDVSNNPLLKTLPDLWQINSLERLDLSNTSLKEIPISALASPHKLRSLNVSCNLIEEFNPLNFKYLESLSQFYIHRNNWNCYNLQMLMDIVVKPLKISYTRDIYDKDFPGEYIHGIQCMYRLEQLSEDYNEGYGSSSQQQRMYNMAPENIAEIKFENAKEVEKLRREFKAIIGFYEKKLSYILEKLNDLDSRLKGFERFNKTMWHQVSVVV
ncbi:uncharacterized protein ACRADG_011443 [Cochliomyia hominivorax]